jgi:hypothetical protein
MQLDALRRALAARGLSPASMVPEASGGRVEEASIQLATLLEGERLQSIPVSARPSAPDPLAFLDGIQRSEVVAYAGSSPIVVAQIAAAVRERRGRRLHTVMEDRQTVALARPSALAQAGVVLQGFVPIALPEEDGAHPVRDLVLAARALDRARGALELALGDRYRTRSDSWLVVDGALSESPRWSADPHMVAISKSHSILPFEGEALERYLRLPPAHRSSVYQPKTRSLAPVCAWGLRLWPWEGRDLLHGLVRVEVAPINGSSQAADTISAWLMAERAPLGLPDPRWDRLLYGIHSVEQYLRSRTA